MVKGDVVAADTFDRLEEIVERARVVIEEDNLLRMPDGPRRGLRAEHDIVGAELELLEPRHHVEVEEEVAGRATRGGDPP